MTRPHWMPSIVWMGVIVGQWPITTFPDQKAAERWAANANWEPERQAYEPRRIWSVFVPEDTVAYSVETIPAATKLNQVHP